MSLSINKIVLVTGASGVLGRQVTNRFLDAGWDVKGENGLHCISDIDCRLFNLGLALNRANKSHLIRCDLADFEETDKIIRDVQVKRFGRMTDARVGAASI